MRWVLHQIKDGSFLSASSSQQPFYVSRSSPSSQSDSFDLNSKISPSVLLVIIILAIVFFVSGLLHLLVRFLLRPRARQAEDSDGATALQGQLQQLFHLHDSGVDQSFIETLPVFHYKAIIGLKDPFDCAVCLCEFEAEDKLRLLPRCSHAFHMDCIDTWLLTHSTCPLCRANLLPDFSPSCSPIVLVLESGSESSREIAIDNSNSSNAAITAIGRTSSHLSCQGNSDLGLTHFDIEHKSGEFLRKDEFKPDPDEKVVPVKLGKFKNIDGGECSSGSHSNNKNNADARRCFSMGHFEYVMDEDTLLQVPITMEKRQGIKKKPLLPLGPGHRPVKSVCIGGESRREFALELAKIIEEAKENGCSIVGHGMDNNENGIMGKRQKESFSISKIWLRGQAERHCDGSSGRRAFSFRFPVNRSVGGSVAADDDVGGELGCGDVVSLRTKTPSFAKRNVFCPVWRQNKVANSSSFASNV